MNTNELHSLHSTPARMTCKLKQKKKAKKKKAQFSQELITEAARQCLMLF